jgi:hypothetical protein
MTDENNLVLRQMFPQVVCEFDAILRHAVHRESRRNGGAAFS